MATDLEQLNVTMNARFDQFSRQLAKADADFQKMSRSVLAKNDNLRKRLSLPLAPLKGLGTALGVGLSVAAVGEFVKSISESVDQIKRQSAALGVSTDQYQELTLAAGQAEVSQDELNTTMDKFAANLGDAQLHATPFSELMKKLKVDIKGGTLPAFMQLIDATNKLSVAQRDAVLKAATGRGYAGLAGFFQQGSAAIKQQMEEFKKSGSIIGGDQIEKIDAMADAWRRLKAQLTTAGANVLGGFSDSLDKMIKDMGSDNFQTALKNFGTIMGQVAGYIIKMGPYLPALTGMMIGGRVGGLPGAVIGGIAGQIGGEMIQGRSLEQWKTYLDAQLARLKVERSTDAALNVARARQAVAQLSNHTYNTHILGGANAAAPKGSLDLTGFLDADKMKALEQRRAELRDQLAKDVSQANASLVAARDELTVKLLTGQTGYHDAVMKMIDDETKAKKDEIKAEADLQRTQAKKDFPNGIPKDVSDQIDAIQKAKDKAADAAAKSKVYDISGDAAIKEGNVARDQQIKQYQDQVSALNLVDGKLAENAFFNERVNDAIQKQIPITAEMIAAWHEQAAAVGVAAQSAADATKISERSIQMTDELRSGLEDVGVAGLHGFKDMKDAAAQFIEQLAEMILKLYVLGPLLDSLLGKQGTSGGGLLGSLLGDIFGGGGDATGVMSPIGIGFAKGGVMTPNGPRMLPRYASGGVSNRAAIFGEAGAEAAVPLPDGRRIPVALRLPSARQLGRGGNFTANTSVNIDARGAQVGVADQIRAVAPLIVGASVKQMRDEFAQNMAKHLQNTF